MESSGTLIAGVLAMAALLRRRSRECRPRPQNLLERTIEAGIGPTAGPITAYFSKAINTDKLSADPVDPCRLPGRQHGLTVLKRKSSKTAIKANGFVEREGNGDASGLEQHHEPIHRLLRVVVSLTQLEASWREKATHF